MNWPGTRQTHSLCLVTVALISMISFLTHKSFRGQAAFMSLHLHLQNTVLIRKNHLLNEPADATLTESKESWEQLSGCVQRWWILHSHICALQWTTPPHIHTALLYYIHRINSNHLGNDFVLKHNQNRNTKKKGTKSYAMKQNNFFFSIQLITSWEHYQNEAALCFFFFFFLICGYVKYFLLNPSVCS